MSLATDDDDDDDDDDDVLLAAALSKEVDAVHECLWLLMFRFDEEDHEKHSEIGTSNSSEQQQQSHTDNNEYIVTRRRIVQVGCFQHFCAACYYFLLSSLRAT